MRGREEKEEEEEEEEKYVGLGTSLENSVLFSTTTWSCDNEQTRNCLLLPSCTMKK